MTDFLMWFYESDVVSGTLFIVGVPTPLLSPIIAFRLNLFRFGFSLFLEGSSHGLV